MDLIPVYHRECKKVAFYSRKRWNVGDALMAKDIVKLNGREPSVGEPIACGACGSKSLGVNVFAFTFEEPK